jgi:hypothetical protein
MAFHSRKQQMNIMYLLYNRKHFYGGWIGRRGPKEWPPLWPQIYSMRCCGFGPKTKAHVQNPEHLTNWSNM